MNSTAPSRQKAVPWFSNTRVPSNQTAVVPPPPNSESVPLLMVLPLPVIRPPVHVNPPFTVKLPAPSSVPAVWVKWPRMVESLARLSVPPASCRSPCTTADKTDTSPPLIVTAPLTGPMYTSSVAEGTTPVLQFLASFQSPPLVASHSLENCLTVKCVCSTPAAMALPARSFRPAVSTRSV